MPCQARCHTQRSTMGHRRRISVHTVFAVLQHRHVACSTHARKAQPPVHELIRNGRVS